MFKTVSQTNNPNIAPEENFDTSSYSDDVFFDDSVDDNTPVLDPAATISTTSADTCVNTRCCNKHITKINIQLANKECYDDNPDVWIVKTPNRADFVGDHNPFFETIFRTTKNYIRDVVVPAALVSNVNTSFKAEMFETLYVCGSEKQIL